MPSRSRYLTVVVALALTALAGCSTGVKHAAAKTGGTSTTGTSGTSTTVRSSTTVHTTTTGGAGSGGAGGGATSGGGGGASGGGGGGGAGTATTKPAPTTSAVPKGPAAIVTFEVSTAPTCESAIGTSTVTVRWTSKDAIEAWLLPGPTAGALVGADAKATSGSFGPLPPNGSKTFAFDCGNDYNYALLEVYNATTHSGRVLQLPSNILGQVPN